MRLAALLACWSCVATAPGPIADAPDSALDREDHYAIWLGGARVGTAIERETWAFGQLTLRREETMRFLRGDASIALSTTVEIVATSRDRSRESWGRDRSRGSSGTSKAAGELTASRVRWTERHTARTLDGMQPEPTRERRAEATRDDDGAWRTSDGTTLPGEAIPAELVPLLVREATRRDAGDLTFSGRVFLPSRSFLSGAGRIDRVAPRRLVARLALDGGAIAEATIDTTDDGTYTRVVDGEGVIAIRVTERQASEPFQPVDLIAATSIQIAGVPSRTLLFDGGIAVPSLPGQLARPETGGVALELSPQLPGDLPYGVFGRDRSREIKQLVGSVRARIAPDLGAHPGSPRDASSATAGDCTTFALAYASLASGREIPTRVVTGLRVDGGRLVRHRWAVSWTGRAWIAVDAAFGAVPAGGDLIGLSVHDADDAGLVAGEAALAQVRTASWR